MDYPLAQPPLLVESFRSLTKPQAQQFFDWYISSIPERLELLQWLFNCRWRCKTQFDFSLESLDPLWQCFEKHIEIEKKSKAEILAQNKGAPQWVIPELLKDRRGLSKRTCAIALDIARYFGETLARNLPGIHWGFLTKPKDLASVNEPVLLGFKGNDYMDPTQTVFVGCYKFLDGSNPQFLSGMVNVWKRYLPEE